MEILYTNLSSRQYYFVKRIQSGAQQIYLTQRVEGHDLVLTISKEKNRNQGRVEALAPITCCHYDDTRKQLLIGDLFGGVMVVQTDNPPRTVHTLNISRHQQPSAKSAILFIDTTNTETLIFTKRGLFVLSSDYQNLSEELELCGELICAAKVPNRDLAVMTFEEFDSPVLVASKNYRELLRGKNRMNKVEVPKDKVEDVIRYSNIKASEEYILVLEEVNGCENRVTLYRLPSSFQANCLKVSRSLKLLSFRASSTTVDIAIKGIYIYIIAKQKFQAINIEKREESEVAGYKNSKLATFQELMG